FIFWIFDANKLFSMAMTRIFIKNTAGVISILFAIMLLASCDNRNATRKEFVWDDEIKELTGENLHAWLEKAPFDNELKKYEKDKLAFTNAKQVFPFLGRYYKAIEELHRNHSTDTDTLIFTETDILFQYSIWTDLFLWATLLYNHEEVFLSDSYLEMGSPFFGGVDAVTEMHRASLYETAVFKKQQQYKTGIYWVSANYRDYLLGFYQQGQLIFETAVPLLRGDTLATLDKLNEISHKLGLNIVEWERAQVADLQRVEDPESFWKDPFQGIYPGEYTDDVYLKTKQTPFVQDDKARKGDYYFSYRSDDGLVELYTELRESEMNKENFEKANKKMDKYRYSYQDIFYEERAENGIVNGVAKTYYKDNQYLEMHFSYPEKDSEAKAQVHSVLHYIKVLNYGAQ